MEQTASPTIFKSPITDQVNIKPPKNIKGFFKTNLGKIIIAILVIAVLAELAYGAYALFSPSGSGQLNILAPQNQISELQSANLSLVADKTGYKAGDTVLINAKLYTGGYTTDSTDLVVKYDPTFLEPKPTNFAKTGNIYSEYPAVQVDKDQGMIGISGITLPGQNGFLGVGNFATLEFTALKTGQTQVTIDYQEGSTADSNVVLSGSSKDILGSIGNADITISESSNDIPLQADNKCESYTQSCQDANGLVGTQICIGGSSVNGTCSYNPINTVSCDVCKFE